MSILDSSPSALAIYYLVVPAEADGRGPTTLSGLGWELLVRLRQLSDHVCGTTHLLGAHPNCSSLWSFDEGRFLPAEELARDRPVALLAAAVFFLEPCPPVSDLVAAALRYGLAVYAGDGSGVVNAVAVHRDRATHDDFLRVLAQLVCCDGAIAQPRWDKQPAVTVLPAHEGGFANALVAGQLQRRPPASAAVYLNAALAEVIYAPADIGPVDGVPERMLHTLLAQRDRSAVPWIFNTLANEVEFRLGLPIVDSFPQELHLSITGLCNIECRFCSYTRGYSIRDYVDVERISRLGFLRHMHTLRLSSGIGEPILDPHLPDILDYVATRYPQIAINFFTNGTTLGRRGLIDALVDQVAWINVSLNAATASTWLELCQKDLFDRVTGGLQALQKAKQERRALLPVVYGSMVLTAKNLHELPQMPALCRKLGVDRFTAIPFFAYKYEFAGKYGAAESLHCCRDDYDAVYADTVREAQTHCVSLELPQMAGEKRATFGVEDRVFHDFAGLDEASHPLHRLVDHLNYAAGSHCPELWRIALAGSTARGHANTASTHFMYPCLGPLVTVDFSARIPFDFPDSESFLALWNNPVFQRLRMAQRHCGLSGVCDVCRSMDTRDPEHFTKLDGLLREWRG